jgi:hypothetical protein
VENDLKTIKVRECEKEESVMMYRGGVRVGRYVKSSPPFL